MASIALRNISKSFGKTEIIKDLNLEIQDGECTVLVGPSGCGKSTLLRIICGLEDITSGEVHIGERCVNHVPPTHRGIAMVFQSYALYPHMTVQENMAFALKVKRVPKAEISRRVQEAAKILRIDGLLDRKPKELSGGQKQRVAIGRCIVREPSAFLFDEPLSNLDASLRHQMRYEIARLKEQLKTTMVYVTHDQEEAMTLADKIVVMQHGRIEQIGTPEDIYRNPSNTFVAGFIGSPAMNFLPVKIIGKNGNMIDVKFSTGETITLKNRYKGQIKDQECILGLRPEDIRLGDVDAENSLKMKVVISEYLGGVSYCHMNMADGAIINGLLKVSNENAKSKRVDIVINPDRYYLFKTTGESF